MYNLNSFRERIIALYRRASPYDEGRRPTQQDLADAIGLSRSELSSRLNGLKNARLTHRDTKAIVRTLAEWGAIISKAEARELLTLVECPSFSAAEWQTAPLADLQEDEQTVLPPPMPTPQATLPPRHTFLPRPLTSFIGREGELASVVRQVTERRLITLIGAGGSGKTRLAIEAARQLRDRFSTGVCFVELVSLRDPGLIAGAIARSLGVAATDDQRLVETMQRYLQEREMLLVLDNCEHLLPVVAELAHQLLTACERLHILATSRELLRIAGELTHQVKPLSLPGKQVVISPTSLSRYEAVQLFVARALTLQPDFYLNVDNVATVQDICQRLDGIPLAIELAAARLRMLTVAQISTQLADRFRLLTGIAHGVQPHHQALRALIDWSYDLLPANEQALFRSLAVFSGGFTIDAVVGVMDIAPLDVLDTLTELLNKSLIYQMSDVADEPRFAMLETIREYTMLKLAEVSGEVAIRQQHAAWYLTLAEAAVPQLRGEQQVVWIDRLEREHDNMREALAWSLVGQPALGLALVGALARFWEVHGHLSEGRRWLELALKTENAPPWIRAAALSGAGSLAWGQDDYPAARDFHQQALQLRRELGDRRGTALSLNNLGFVVLRMGDLTTAQVYYEESIDIAREIGDFEAAATGLHNLGTLARIRSDFTQARALYAESLELRRKVGDKWSIALTLHLSGAVAADQGDYQAAQELNEESLTIRRQLGDKQGIASSLLGLAVLAYYQCDYDIAREMYEQSMVLFQEVGFRMGLATAIGRLGDISYGEGDYPRALQLGEDSLRQFSEMGNKWLITYALNRQTRTLAALGEEQEARSLYEQGLTLHLELGDRQGVAEFLEGMAGLAVAQHASHAATLWGAAETIREEIGAPLSPTIRASYEHQIKAARNQLGNATFARAWLAGRTMQQNEAILATTRSAQSPVGI